MKQLLAVLTIAAVFMMGYVAGYEPTAVQPTAYSVTVEEAEPPAVTWDYIGKLAAWHGHYSPCYEDELQLQTWVGDSFGRTVCIPLDDIVEEVEAK